MFYQPNKYLLKKADVNDALLELKGELTDQEARIALSKFLRTNIGMTVELLCGMKLEPFQEITLKGLLNSNYSLCVWGRGCGKTHIASVFTIVQTIFEPNSKVIIAGPTFRTARAIFSEIEKMVRGPKSKLLRDCFEMEPSKKPDLLEWQINGGSIRAIPLNGEKIRGFRANILVIDEFLLVPENIIKEVLMPFLASPQNLAEIISVKGIEDELIKMGKMKESERIVFPNMAKLVGLSSASYSFENLYRTYQSWVKNIEMSAEEEKKIMDRENEGKTIYTAPPRYFVSQLAYNAVPEHMINQSVVIEAKTSGGKSASFQREYGAQFVDGSDSYFSARKMTECTVESGKDPHVQIFPRKGARYIISIDPSFSDKESSDHFSMSVLETDFETEVCALVHNYVVAGGHTRDHHNYFHYLYTTFKPELVIIDNAGWEFIGNACQTEKFVQDRIDIKFIDFKSDLEGLEYEIMLREAKQQYNKENHCVAIKQFFSPAFRRRANEHLKLLIDMKRILFASPLNSHDSLDATLKKLEKKMPFDVSATEPNEGFLTPSDLIDFQDDWIYETKKQCALIEISVNPQGSYSFKLPTAFSKDKTKNKIRKDSYTSLFLGAWANKCYYDMMRVISEDKSNSFTPVLI